MKRHISDKITGKIILGAMGHVTTPEFAAQCLDEGIAAVLPSFIKAPEGLAKDIQKAKELSQGRSLLGVNLLVYGKNYEPNLKACNREKVDFITMSAGFDKTIFSKTSIPVFVKVSSLSLAKYAESLGASAIIAMGSDAGGHIGFPKKQDMKTTEELVSLIRGRIGIPIIASGGLVSREDIKKIREAGADAFQLGTRLLVTKECGVDEKTKQAYIDAGDDDIVLVQSTTGLPLRVIKTGFAERVLADKTLPPKKCINCLKNCSKKYCLQERIRKGMMGEIDDSLLPASENTGRIGSILSIRDIGRWVG
ncbi:nitronate monooxygenase [Candidatus Woesearchaeota archaeon]|nr:nitronate monooxygenase [Candidatus Woesearchaeota archaeon]